MAFFEFVAPAGSEVKDTRRWNTKVLEAEIVGLYHELNDLRNLHPDHRYTLCLGFVEEDDGRCREIHIYVARVGWWGWWCYERYRPLVAVFPKFDVSGQQIVSYTLRTKSRRIRRLIRKRLAEYAKTFAIKLVAVA